MLGRLIYIGLAVVAVAVAVVLVLGNRTSEGDIPIKNSVPSSASPTASSNPAASENPPAPGTPLPEAQVVVDATTVERPISSLIYGVSMSEGAKPYFEDAGVSVLRWGGNARTRFNWEINASNAGADWEFRNLEKGGLIPGKAAVDFHKSNQDIGAFSLLTIPMIGWVARDQDEETRSEDVPDSDDIDGYDPRENRQQTSVASVARKSEPFQYPPDLEDGVVYQDEWVHYLTQELGQGESGGIQFYEMDNEPMLWRDTHRDVRPDPIGNEEYFELFDSHSAALKFVDPSAQIFAPAVWGWTAYFDSSVDYVNKYVNGTVEINDEELPFLAWFLDKAKEQDEQDGVRSLDYLSVHYYPEGRVFSEDVSEEMQAQRLRSTRSLWDPEYADESWIVRTDQGPYVNLIPRLRNWIETYYPGTKLAITEWNWGAMDHISGGLATADVLGIMGREGVDFATIWGSPAEGSPVFWSFKMFRNYDGQGSGFGDDSVKVTGDQTGLVSTYASVDSNAGLVKILLINKSPDTAISVPIDVNGAVPDGSVSVYQFGADTPDGIRQGQEMSLNGVRVSPTLPPYSLTMLVTARQGN